MKKIIAFVAFSICLLSGMNQIANANDKTVNVTVQPLGFLIGVANVAAEFGVSDTVAIGPSISYSGTTVGSTTVSNLGFGLSADFFLNHKRFTDGIMLSLGLGYSHATAGTLSASGVGAQGQFGYGWFWDGGFNMILQGGIAYSSAQVLGYSVSAIVPSIGFQIGWAF